MTQPWRQKSMIFKKHLLVLFQNYEVEIATKYVSNANTTSGIKAETMETEAGRVASRTTQYRLMTCLQERKTDATAL